MIDYDDLLSSGDHTSFFNQLITLNRSQIMELTYRALVTHKMGALTESSASTAEKIEALEIMIKWFESLEEYEKCHNLKKIIQNL